MADSQTNTKAASGQLTSLRVFIKIFLPAQADSVFTQPEECIRKMRIGMKSHLQLAGL